MNGLRKVLANPRQFLLSSMSASVEPDITVKLSICFCVAVFCGAAIAAIDMSDPRNWGKVDSGEDAKIAIPKTSGPIPSDQVLQVCNPLIQSTDQNFSYGPVKSYTNLKFGPSVKAADIGRSIDATRSTTVYPVQIAYTRSTGNYQSVFWVWRNTFGDLKCLKQ